MTIKLLSFFILLTFTQSINPTEQLNNDEPESCISTRLHTMFYYNDRFYVLTNQAVYRYERIRTKLKRDERPSELRNQIEIVFKVFHRDESDPIANMLLEHKNLFANHSGLLVHSNGFNNYSIYFFQDDEKTLLFESDQLVDRNVTPSFDEKNYRGSSWGLSSENTYVYFIFNRSIGIFSIDYRFIKNGIEVTNLIHSDARYNVSYIGFIPFKNNLTIESAYQLTLDENFLLHIDPVERQDQHEILSFYDLILCRRHLCDPNFRLKGFTYFEHEKTYAYFVDNTFILSPKNLIDLYNKKSKSQMHQNFSFSITLDSRLWSPESLEFKLVKLIIFFRYEYGRTGTSKIILQVFAIESTAQLFWLFFVNRRGERLSAQRVLS